MTFGPLLAKNVYLLDQIDRVLQIHTEVDELPLNTFLLVFLLLQHKHVVVELLLQTLVRVVDAQLLECVVLWGRMKNVNGELSQNDLRTMCVWGEEISELHSKPMHALPGL